MVCFIEDKPGEPASIVQKMFLVPGLHHCRQTRGAGWHRPKSPFGAWFASLKIIRGSRTASSNKLFRCLLRIIVDKPGEQASIAQKVFFGAWLAPLRTKRGSRLASPKECFGCQACIIEETLGEPASIVKHVCWCLVCIIEDKPGGRRLTSHKQNVLGVWCALLKTKQGGQLASS